MCGSCSVGQRSIMSSCADSNLQKHFEPLYARALSLSLCAFFARFTTFASPHFEGSPVLPQLSYALSVIWSQVFGVDWKYPTAPKSAGDPYPSAEYRPIKLLIISGGAETFVFVSSLGCLSQIESVHLVVEPSLSFFVDFSECLLCGCAAPALSAHREVSPCKAGCLPFHCCLSRFARELWIRWCASQIDGQDQESSSTHRRAPLTTRPTALCCRTSRWRGNSQQRCGCC